jgi:hypothetical protein
VFFYHFCMLLLLMWFVPYALGLKTILDSYCRNVNLFLDNLEQARYVVSLGYDIENFVEGRKYPLVQLIYLQCRGILPNKKQMFHSKFMYIP